ncbi:MAG: leucine-rich repeat domain-containing protein, partial [Candidatus Methanomethylophilaceae archaeon]|nr:leucine-rich repeat domain-containing protein [Candidatus Methanomethylophilaceae archaeon]
MTMALIVLSLCFVGILLSDGVDSTEGDEFVDSGLVYRVVSDSDRTVTVFSSNTVPADLIIPDTVENDSIEYKVISIDGYAFGRQSGIISVDVGDNVRIIGQQAFNHCSSMTSISMPDGLVSIGKEAFLGCDSLNSITIPKNVSDIGDYVFDIGSLTAINVDVNNPNYSSVDGVLFDKGKVEIIKYPRGKSGETYTIPNTVVSIANGAFSECSLTSVSISGDLISIGDNSFESCSKLTTIKLPKSLTSIGVSAFNECSKLAAIEIFSGVESISESAFENCSALSSVTLSD